MSKKQETEARAQDEEVVRPDDAGAEAAHGADSDAARGESDEAAAAEDGFRGEPGEDSAERRIAELEAQVAELKDSYLRKVADFDNYRKRMVREKQDAFDYANTNLLGDLLESLDNFDRALESARNATDVRSVVDGVQMTKDQLVSMLENKYNLTGYGEAGDAFDPNIHEAIGSVPGPVAEPVCSEVYLKGYKLKERVIRHAKVMVRMPDGSVSGSGGAEDASPAE